MKKSCVILTSIIGGAILGSAVTMCVCPKAGHEFRKDAHQMILGHIEAIKDHLKRCRCAMGGKCEMENNSEAVVATDNEM